jgi:hypothetical protein
LEAEVPVFFCVSFFGFLVFLVFFSCVDGVCGAGVAKVTVVKAAARTTARKLYFIV